MRRHRQRDQGIDARTHRLEPRVEVVQFGKRKQRQFAGNPLPNSLDEFAEMFDLIKKPAVYDDQVGRQRTQHFLEFFGTFQTIDRIAELAQRLGELATERRNV